jgi:hypothetical protein
MGGSVNAAPLFTIPIRSIVADPSQADQMSTSEPAAVQNTGQPGDPTGFIWPAVIPKPQSTFGRQT